MIEISDLTEAGKRIIALDAAACAAEDLRAEDCDEDLRAAISLLQDALDKHFANHPKFGDFEDYLVAQREAVKYLSQHPEFFGAPSWACQAEVTPA